VFYICTCPVLGSYPNELQTVYCCRLTISGYWVASFPFWYRIILSEWYGSGCFSRQTRDCSSPDLNGVLASSNCFRLSTRRDTRNAQEREAKELILDDNKHKTGHSHIGLNLGLERTTQTEQTRVAPPLEQDKNFTKAIYFPDTHSHSFRFKNYFLGK
jgi:hypothetical protein